MIFTYSATSVTLPGAEPSWQYKTTHRQNKGVTEGGYVRMYNRGINEYMIPVKFRLTTTQLTALYTFLNTTVQWAALVFSCTPDSGVDIGAGAGTAVNVRCWSDDWAPKWLSADRWEVELLLRREAT